MSLHPRDNPVIRELLDQREAAGLPRHIEDPIVLRQIRAVLDDTARRAQKREAAP